MKKETQAKFDKLAEKIKSEPPMPITQKVIPITNVTEEETEQLNVRISKTVLKKLKAKGLELDKNLKQMVAEAIQNYYQL